MHAQGCLTGALPCHCHLPRARQDGELWVATASIMRAGVPARCRPFGLDALGLARSSALSA